MNTPKKRKYDFKTIMGWVLFASLVASCCFTIVRLFTAPGAQEAAGEFDKQRSDYALMLLQCLLGIVVMMLPSFIHHRWSVPIPNFIYILYYVFLYCAVFLGEVFSFYYRIAHWDTILHTFSGMMLACLGFILVSLLHENTHGNVSLSPFFISLFAFCFALAMGTIWEVYEFAMDSLMKLNMQKYLTEQGVAVIGREALMDTMEDLICDAGAAFVVSVIGYFMTKRQQIRQKNEEPEKSLPLVEGQDAL